jgi:hypothetical protein
MPDATPDEWISRIMVGLILGGFALCAVAIIIAALFCNPKE